MCLTCYKDRQDLQKNDTEEAEEDDILAVSELQLNELLKLNE